MRFTPTKPVSLRTPNGPKVYRPGDTFEASEEKARPYIERGLIRPVADHDPFKSGFDRMYQRLVDTGGVWERTRYREPIRAALNAMDAAWVRRDLPGFQAAIQEIERLVGLASDGQT